MNPIRRSLCALALTGLFGAGVPSLAAGPDDDKAARQVVERYFAALGRKDLDGVMAVWHPQSPDFAKRRQGLAAIFAETGPIAVKRLVFGRVKFSADRAAVEFEVELEGTE